MGGYHILKRKIKGKVVYHIGILSMERGKNGKAKYEKIESLGTAFYAKARDRATEKMEEFLPPSKDFKLSDYLINFWTPGKSEYLRTKENDKVPLSTAYCKDNRKCIEKHFLPYFPDYTISRLTKRALMKWRNDLMTAGIAHTVINHTKQCISAAFQYAFNFDEMSDNPMKVVPRVPYKTPEKEIFQRYELDAIFGEPWTDLRAYAGALLAWDCGLRAGEVRGLRWKHVHLEARFLEVRENWVQGAGLKGPKDDSVRSYVGFAPEVVAALRMLFDNNPWSPVTGDHYVFYSNRFRSNPCDRKVVENGFFARLKACNIERRARTFHSLRHSYATHVKPLVGGDLVITQMHKRAGMDAHYGDHLTEEQKKILLQAADALVSRGN
jgi:integrase